jgi:hypothetical protein
MNTPPETSRKISLPDAAALLWVGVVFVVACGVRSHMMAGTINDEAVELLQALDLPSDHWYYFVPAYRGGVVDLIESLPSYLNRGLWHCFGSGPRPILVFHAGLLAAAVGLLQRAVRRTYGPGWGLVAAILLGGSSYTLFYDQLLTRNALSPFWGALVVWLAVVTLTAVRTPVCLAALGGLSVAVTLAMASYTSFKLLAVPLYFALLLALVGQRRWVVAGGALLSALLVALLTATALQATETPAAVVFERGRYAMASPRDLPRFGRHLWRTAVLPMVRDPEYRDFVTEETNDGYARAMLPPIAAPFFALGLVGAFRRGRSAPVEAWCAWTFLLAVPVFALGGPNLKHCLVLFPWIATSTAFGLRCASRWALPRWEEAAALGVGLVLALFAMAEARHLLVTIPSNPRLAFMNGAAEATAETLARYAPGRTDAVLVGTLGVDVAQLRMRREAAAHGTSPIAIHWFYDRWEQGLKVQLRAKPDAMILAQGEKDPQFFARSEGLRECYDKTVVQVGRHVDAVFVPTGRCSSNVRTP